MSLAQVLTRFVSAGVRQRGQEYFRRRWVALGDCGPLAANALVNGTQVYAVDLARRSSHILASCSCPYVVDRREPCKHLWATLLAVDARGGLRGGDGSLPRRLVLAGDAEDEPPVDDSSSAAPRPSAWRGMVNKVAPTPAAPAPTVGEIVYVVDAPATLESGKLTLEVLAGSRKADGSPGALKPPRITPSQLTLLPDAADSRILSLLTGVSTDGAWSSSYLDIATRFSVQDPASLVLIPMLCATGRCRLRRTPGGVVEPLAWDDGAAWELGLEVREESDSDLAVTGSLRRGERRLDLATPVLVMRSGLLVRGGLAGRHNAADSFGWVSLLRGSGKVPVPAAEAGELLEHLLTAPTTPPLLQLPEALRFEEVRLPPRPRLRLRKPDRWQSYQGSPRGDLTLLYGGREVPAGTPGRGLYEPAERRFLLRDPAAEAQAVERLTELGFRPVDDGLRLGASRVPEVVRTLLGEGWAVEAENKLYRPAGRRQASVTSGIDWFELHGSVEFDGEVVELPRLLAALRRGDGFVPLADGSLGMLPEEWLNRIASVARLGSAEGDHVRFRSAQAAFLDALLADEPEATCDATFAEARRRLQSFAGVAPVDPPAGFRGELRGYQREGLGWLQFLGEFGFGGCLADDMGLGKTVQVLALLESRRALRAERQAMPAAVRRSVCRRCRRRWSSCRARWSSTGSRGGPLHAPAAGARLHRPRPAARRQVVPGLRPGPHHLRHAAARRRRCCARSSSTTSSSTRRRRSRTPTSQTAKAARLLRGRHRLALTGTPVENHLGELWSLLRVPEPRHDRLGGARRRDRRRAARCQRPGRRDAPALRARPAAVHPAPHQGAGRAGPAREDRADPLLRAGAPPAPALRRAARPLPRRRSAPASASRASAAPRSRCSRRCCACARRPATPA